MRAPKYPEELHKALDEIEKGLPVPAVTRQWFGEILTKYEYQIVELESKRHTEMTRKLALAFSRLVVAEEADSGVKEALQEAMESA